MQLSPADETPRSPARAVKAWAIAVTATLGMSVSYVDRQTLAAIAPSVTKALSIDNTQYGWLLGAFSMAYLLGAPLSGVVVDKLGARKGFAIAVLVWSIVAGAHAMATSFAALLSMRLLLGAAESPSFPASTQTIRRVLPESARPLAFGLLFTGSSLGSVVAATLAVRLDAVYGYRGAFLGTALLGAVWLPVWLLVTRGAGLDGRIAEAAKSDAPRASVRATIMSPAVLRSVVAIAGSAPALMFVLGWTSKYLVDGWGLPKQSIGLYLVAPPILFDLGAVGFGALASSREAGRRRTRAERKTEPLPLPELPELPERNTRRERRAHAPLLIAAMLLAALLALTPLAPSAVAAVALLSTAACGCGGIYALVTADMLARVPVDRTSTAGGTTAAAQSFATIVASPLVGFAIDRTGRYDAALVAIGLTVVPTTLAFIAWPGLQRKAAPL